MILKEEIKNKIKSIFKASPNGWMIFFIILFFLLLANITASIFLFKKVCHLQNSLTENIETTKKNIEQMESKIGAVYSQVYRLRNQQFENYVK